MPGSVLPSGANSVGRGQGRAECQGGWEGCRPEPGMEQTLTAAAVLCRLLRKWDLTPKDAGRHAAVWPSLTCRPHVLGSRESPRKGVWCDGGLGSWGCGMMGCGSPVSAKHFHLLPSPSCQDSRNFHAKSRLPARKEEEGGGMRDEKGVGVASGLPHGPRPPPLWPWSKKDQLSCSEPL